MLQGIFLSYDTTLFKFWEHIISLVSFRKVMLYALCTGYPLGIHRHVKLFLNVLPVLRVYWLL